MIEVYTDGASRGNPGKSGAGIFIKANGNNYEFEFSLPEMTNHEAEFHAVMKALDICQQRFPNEVLSFRSDSQIVVDTIEKKLQTTKHFNHFLKKLLI